MRPVPPAGDAGEYFVRRYDCEVIRFTFHLRAIIYLELGGTVIELIAVDNPSPKTEALWEVGYRGLALEVTNMAEAVNYLQNKGVAIAVKPVDLGDSVRGEIRDPDGLMIELRQWK